MSRKFYFLVEKYQQNTNFENVNVTTKYGADISTNKAQVLFILNRI